MKKTTLILLLLLMTWSNVSSQKYHFKKYGYEEGLAHNQTFDIIQSSDNRLWIATLGGVSSFNGSQFTNYTTEDGLASDKVLKVFEDSKGRIWLGTFDNGISIIDHSKITTPKPKGINFFELGSVNDFLETPDGVIYIFCNRGIIEYKDNTFLVLNNNNLEENTYKTSGVAMYDNNTLYLSSTGFGILKITLNPYKKEVIDNESHGINNICYSISIDNEKNIWIGSYGALYKLKDDKITEYIPNINDLDSNRIWSIYQDDNDELVLGFEGNGFGKFNKTTGVFEIINMNNGLPSKYIYCITKDNEQNYWMATFGEGIIRFRDTSFSFYDESQGLPSTIINDVVEWNDQWILATDNGLIPIKDGKTQKPIISNKPIQTLIKTPKNELLIATKSEVLQYSEKKKLKNIVFGNFLNLYQDEDRIFLGASNTLTVIEKDTTYTIKYRRSLAIKSIGDRYVFAKTYGVLQYKDGKQDTIPGIHPSKNKNIHTIDAINKNELLIGGDKGLYHITLKDSIFNINTFSINEFPSLKSINSLNIYENDLWLSSNKALSKVNLKLLLEKDSVNIINYKPGDGFMGVEINEDALEITKDGTVLAASNKGLLIFNENNFHKNDTPPSLNLSSVLLFSEPISDSTYSKSKSLELPFKQNYLTFNMETITFTNPEDVMYKYRLEGLRDEGSWSVPSKENQVVFSYLPPGKYNFEFTANNGNGIWQEQTFNFPFTIKVPYWKTWSFWYVLLGFLTVLTVIILYVRNKTIQKKQEQFTQSLINAQEEERTRVARELHDSVGQKLVLLKKKTEIIGNNEMKILANATLEELQNISRGLHPAILEQLGITVAIKSLIKEVDANSNFFFSYEIDIIDSLLNKEKTLHLYRIIQEVLNNMVKHSDAKVASVSIKNKKNTIEVVIKDNGKGFDFSKKINNNSLGMKTILERVKIIKSKLEIQSNSKKGTTIKIIIPTNYD